MEISQLKAFIEVAGQKSFSRAAEKLFISQSAVSKRIGNLESELGTALFDRIGKKVELTEVGQNLLNKAKDIILNIENLQQSAWSLPDSISGPLIMATSHHIGLHRLSPVLGKFNQTYPEVKLDIRFMDSEQACELVENGEIELAIVTLPQNPALALKIKTLWVDELAFVVDKNHPLAKLKKININDFLDYPAVLPAKETFTRRILENAIDQTRLKVNMSTNYLETLKMLTLAGLGWSILPKTMLDKKLKVLDINLKITRNLGSVVHRGRTLSRAAKSMLEMLNPIKV